MLTSSSEGRTGRDGSDDDGQDRVDLHGRLDVRLDVLS